MARKYKNEKYKGITIKFIESDGRIWAQAPSITKHYIGVGKTKAQAFADAKNMLDALLSKQKPGRRK